MSKRAKSDEMAELCARVHRWREQNGGRGSRIPDGIGRAAVRVAWRAGLYATARACRLNYERLKERRDQAGGNGALVAVRTGDATKDAGHVAKAIGTSRSRAGSGGAKAHFVAVQLPTMPAERQATIEVVSRHGARMRVEVRGEMDVAGLLHSFWSQSS